MIAHYLKAALRNLKRAKVFSLVNILGLAVGMAACLLILHYVSFEKSYDRFHKGSDRIYRLRYERTSEDGTAVRFASCTGPAAEAIRGVFPEVETIARIYRYPSVVSHKERNIEFSEERLYCAEPDFFRIFSVDVVEGDPLRDLAGPNTAFISRSTAEKYFGTDDPIGKTLTVDGKTDFAVTGLFEDVPPNSHLKFDIVLGYESLRTFFPPVVYESWGYTGFFTYLRFREGADPQAFQEQMPDLVRSKCGELMDAYKVVIELTLQPITDIHLTSHFMQEYEANGSADSVNFLMIAAAFIVAMAWVNYVNLSTARALTRAREVGLRKVAGASRRQIMTQLFVEAAVVNFAAVVLALWLVRMFLPLFREISGTPASYVIWEQSWFWAAAAVMFLAGVFLSGAYPVALVSAFNPAPIIKGSLGAAPRGMTLRRTLVVLQFVIALVLLTGALTVQRQVGFMKNQGPGFDMDRVLVIKAPRIQDEVYREKFEVFKEELLKRSDIRNMCVATEVPGRQIYWDAGAIHKAGEDAGRGKNYQIVGIDYDYLDLFGLKLKSGRNFSKEFPTDEMGLILNETAVRWMGLEGPDQAVGEQVDYWGEIYTVVGVLVDFHQQSMKQAFEPHLYRLMPYARPEFGRFALKLGPAGDIAETVAAVGQRFAEAFPGNPFEYFFLDDYYNEQFQGDILFGRVVGIFSFLAMFVTGLGIFGMSASMAVQRTREIGIRKVLGATTGGIMKLLASDFLTLLIVSVVVAWPLTYWGIQRWLDGFARRMPIGPVLFAFPLIIVAAVTVLTIAANITKAAAANPVEAIKNE